MRTRQHAMGNIKVWLEPSEKETKILDHLAKNFYVKFKKVTSKGYYKYYLIRRDNE